MIEQIKEKMGNSKDLVVRELDLYNEKVSLVFFECLCDSRNINDFVLEYLSYLKTNKKIIEGRIYSSDVFYSNVDISDLYNNKKCLCVEMESFALFYNALKLNKNAACLLTISDNLETKEETTALERQNSFNEMIELALDTAIEL